MLEHGGVSKSLTVLIKEHRLRAAAAAAAETSFIYNVTQLAWSAGSELIKLICGSCCVALITLNMI